MSKGKKQEIYNYIKMYIEKEGISPTLNEIKNEVKLKSVSTVHQHVKDLISSGVLVVDDFGGYDIASIEQKNEDVQIIGYIAAGLPIEAIEDKKYYYATGNRYALTEKNNTRRYCLVIPEENTTTLDNNCAA